MIKMEKVTKVFKGDVVALRDVTIDIGKGEFVFLVGPSGSGKSTFIRLLNREDVPEHGRIFVAGRDIGRLSGWRVPYLRRNIGYVFQDYKLLQKKTVAENVAFALEVIGKGPQVINRQVARHPGAGRAVPQDGPLPPRAVGGRAAAGVDRPGLRQPAA